MSSPSVILKGPEEAPKVKTSGKCCLCSATMAKLAVAVAAVACVVGILALPAVGIITIIPASAALAMMAIGGATTFVGLVTACISCCKGKSITEDEEYAPVLLSVEDAKEQVKQAQKEFNAAKAEVANHTKVVGESGSEEGSEKMDRDKLEDYRRVFAACRVLVEANEALEAATKAEAEAAAEEDL